MQLVLRISKKPDYQICVMQFNSFGDIFSQTIALIHNQDNGLVSRKIVLVPTFKSINKEKFNADLFRDIKFSIESFSETVVVRVPRFLQFGLLKMIDFNYNRRNPLVLPKLTVTSSQLKLRKNQILKYRHFLKVSSQSKFIFSRNLKKHGIDDDYVVVAIRSAKSTKSKFPTQSEVLRSSSVSEYVPLLEYLAIKYRNVILFSDQVPNSILPSNVVDYNRSSLKSNLMDYMFPINSKVLIGNLYGITDTRLMEFSGIFIATDVPILTLHWGALIDFALPKTISKSNGNETTNLQLLYDKKYFHNHIYTDEFFNDFEFTNNSSDDLLYFIKNCLEEPISLKINSGFRNEILNQFGILASTQYSDAAYSGLDSPIDCYISKKYLEGNFPST